MHLIFGMRFPLSGISILDLGLAAGTLAVSSIESPVNDNAFYGRGKSVQSSSLPANRFETRIFRSFAADTSDTASFLASRLNGFV